MATKASAPAAYQRSDVCAVPAASVIVENVVAFEIASAIVEKYVGTSLGSIKTAMAAMHELNRTLLAEWERKTGASEDSSPSCHSLPRLNNWDRLLSALQSSSAYDRFDRGVASRIDSHQIEVTVSPGSLF
jgi:hypothetical protein